MRDRIWISRRRADDMGRKSNSTDSTGNPPTARPSVGNVQLSRSLGDRARLQVSEPSEPEEQEADRVSQAIADSRAPESFDLAANARQTALPGDEPANTLAADSGKQPGTPVAQMGALLGIESGAIRVHDRAGDRALADGLGSRAFALGHHIWLGSRSSESDRALMAHELAHVAQSRRRPGNAPGRIQRSITGGLVGGSVGFVGGAALGAALGPFGALAGGLLGGLAGAWIGNRLTDRSRPLTTAERSYADEVFKGSVNYDPIIITQDDLMSVGAPKTIGNTIHLKTSSGHFVPDPARPGEYTMDLTDKGKETMVHEMAHAWQYQNGGLAYIGESLWAQLKAWWSTGKRGGAYNWSAAKAAGLPWEQWNPEQQAKAVEEYNIALQKALAKPLPKATAADYALITLLQPEIDELRLGKGAAQTSVFGAILGGVTGGILGAAAGYLVGGPKGAAIGGAGGAALGTFVGSG